MSEGGGKTSKLVKRSQVAVMVLAGVLLLAHMFKWPVIRVDGVTLTLLGILLVAPLSDLIRHIKWGDFEADIGRDEVARAQAMAEPALAQRDQTVASEEPEQRVRELLREDPQLAMARVRIDLEQALKRLYLAAVDGNADVSRLSMRRMIDGLRRTEVLNGSIAAALLDVVTLANRAVHGESVEPGAASDLALLGVRLVEELQFLYHEHAIRPERTDISPALADRYDRARYIVRTVVPIVGEPYMNTYEMDQEALDTFLEGYDEFAEFLVEIRPVDEPSA